MIALLGCVGPPAPIDRIVVPGLPVPARSIPLAGGIADGSDGWLVASDPDGDRVLVVALADESVREVRFPDGWAPRR